MHRRQPESPCFPTPHQHPCAPLANFTLPGCKPTVQCIYTNKLLPGAIKITKVSSKVLTDTLAGATFSITDSIGHLATTAEVTPDGFLQQPPHNRHFGVVCLDNLPIGDYTVDETGPPSGLGNGDPTTGNGCPPLKRHEERHMWERQRSDHDRSTDPPLTDITASATSEDLTRVGGGSKLDDHVYQNVDRRNGPEYN